MPNLTLFLFSALSKSLLDEMRATPATDRLKSAKRHLVPSDHSNQDLAMATSDLGAAKAGKIQVLCPASIDDKAQNLASRLQLLKHEIMVFEDLWKSKKDSKDLLVATSACGFDRNKDEVIRARAEDDFLPPLLFEEYQSAVKLCELKHYVGVYELPWILEKCVEAGSSFSTLIDTKAIK